MYKTRVYLADLQKRLKTLALNISPLNISFKQLVNFQPATS